MLLVKVPKPLITLSALHVSLEPHILFPGKSS